MIRWFLALALAALATPALAQNTQCSTRPAGDSTNACASTAFVTSAIGSIAITCPAGQFVNVISASGSTCAAAVTSISNSDSTLTISPTTGPAIASINLAHSNTWTAAQNLTLAQNAGTFPTVTNSSSGTSAYGGYTASNGTNTATFSMTGASYTLIPVIANRATVFAGGTGIAVDTGIAAPIVFGVNNAEVGRWNSSTPGELDIGASAALGGVAKLFGSTQGSLALNTAANVAANSTITFPNATTDFSATGGASQVVKQTTSGGAFSVAQVAVSELSGSLRQIIALSSATGTQAQNTTSFFLNFLGPGGTAEATASALCPISGTFKNLRMQSNAPASGQTFAFTVRVNGADTALTCTITGVGTTCNDTTHTAACTAGQTYSVKSITSATSGTATGISGGMEFDNP